MTLPQFVPAPEIDPPSSDYGAAGPPSPPYGVAGGLTPEEIKIVEGITK